jgi:hypothetical protein
LAYQSRADSSPASLARRALDELKKGDVANARQWLQLGALRGDDEMAAMDEFLREHGDEHGASSVPGNLMQRLEQLAAPANSQ